MFTVKDGMIVITSEAAHISEVYTPEEWEAHILYLLDLRDEARRELADVKLVEIPERPANMDIAAFVQWKIEADEAAKQRAALENRKQELRLKSDSAERKIVRMMPENVMLSIEDDENDCTYSIWWTSKHDNSGNWYPDVRIQSSPKPARVVPMSQQIGDDEDDNDDNLSPGTNRWGAPDKKPAPVPADPQPQQKDDDSIPMSKRLESDDLESDLEKALWDIETDEDGLEVEYEDEDTVEEYGDDDPATESDNAFGYDDEEEIGGVPSEYSGENDEPPAPATVDDIPF